MKKINSVHYGGTVLAVGAVIGVVLPGGLWVLGSCLENKVLFVARNLCFALGMLVFVLFFLHLAMEFHQDKKIETYYMEHKKIRVPKADGTYECGSCGSRQVTKDDRYCRSCGVVFEEFRDKTSQEILDNKRSAK